VWTVDHLAFHTGIVEPVVALSAAAAVTARIRLGFGVLLAALRHPAQLAKQLGSLQALSGDRVALGVGVGGENPSEWAAAGVPLCQRGQRTDTFLAALPDLLTGRPTRLPASWDAEVPPLCPCGAIPPIWIGGRGPAEMERVAHHGEGWLGLFGLSAEQSRRHMVAGTEAHVLAALRAFVGAGVDQFVLFPAAPDYPAQYERFARFADRLRASRDLIGSGL
jgi:alkanesulfonate monooxygenase SsuD/methylene tetrahydromethanopterin reductase-like flavin-dependent oxidoreductase (luciferase family)